MEARIAQQQASFDQLHQQNVFILSNLHMRPDMDGEEARAERTKRITEALKVTTFTVAEKDIFEKKDEMAAGIKKSSIHVDEELGAVLDHETMDNSVLNLPPDGHNASRGVPGGCAICLCPYEPGDQVAWSGEECCKHAFHSECIIPWLAKKSEPKCPCCRQDYCVVEPVTAADLAPMTPFGLIPTSLNGQTAIPFGTEEGIIPTPDLEASQVVTETGIVSIPEQPQTPTVESDIEIAEENVENAEVNVTDVALDEETGEINLSTDDSTPTAESSTETIVPQADPSATTESSPESPSA